MACPNINLDSWKNLVAARGEDVAYYLWDRYEGEVPKDEYISVKETVFFQLDKSKLPAAQEKLDNQLLTFLSQFGVTAQEVNNFKERFGIDALGATDVMQKLIYLSSRRNVTTMPEEAAHMMVMLMGKNHPLIKEAFTNIENWSGYNAVKKQYMPIYKDENKVKIEALGHLIRDAIVNKYTSENSVEKSIFQKIKELIDNFFKSIRNKFGVKRNDEMIYDKQAVMKIAEGMLSGDTSLVTSQRSFRYSTNVDYYKALEKDPLAKQIVKEYTENIPFKLTGSLAIAKQTNIQRWSGEPIHDLDFRVPKKWLDKNGEQEFEQLMNKPNIVKLREIRNEYSSYHTKSYLQAPEGYRIELKGERLATSSPMMDINVYDEKGNKLSILESLDKVKTLDFFIGTEEEINFENVASWQDIIDGKLNMSPLGEKEVMFDRPKDQTDYINITPINLQESKTKNLYFQTEELPSSKASEETLNRVKTVLEKSNPELANAVYEALGFKTKTSENEITRGIKEVFPYKAIGNYSNIEEGLVGRNQYETKIGDDTYVFEISNYNYENEDGTYQSYYDIDFTVNGSEELVGTGFFDKSEKAKQIIQAIISQNYGNDTIRFNVEESKKGKQRLLLYKRLMNQLGYNPSDEMEYALFYNIDSSRKINLTPKQKQQAQQLYSQYLDTIFPDSKVKDIVYHTNTRGRIENFNSNRGLFVTPTWELAKTYKPGTNGKRFQLLINSQNIDIVSEDVVMEGKKQQGDTLSYSEEDYIEYVVFEPEQIHILGSKQDIEGFKEFVAQTSSQSMMQLEDMSMSTASESTIAKVKEVLKKMGVSIQSLADYAKSNPAIDAKSVNGVADLVRGVVAVATGREDVALTEEMVHIATAILEQTNPKLVTEMISKIDRFAIYKQTLEAYKNNKAYQLPNGKPDIRKIKKEAVDKLIAELIINQNEGSTEFPELMAEENRSIIRRWWNAITDFIKGMYKKSNISIFEEAATAISEGDVKGTVTDIETQDIFYQLTDAQKNTIDKIKAQQNNIEKVEEKKESDPLLLDSEEANNYYRIKQADGTFVTSVKRVTDRVKAWYKQRFGDKTFTEAEKKFNNLKREYGIKYHGYFEEIHSRYYNEDGSKKAVPAKRPSISDPVDADVYDKIEKYYTELISLLPEGTAVLSEVMIYDPKQKEAGTIDFLAIDKNGKANILDWKFMYVADESKTDDVAWFKQGAYNIQLGRYKEILKDAYGVKEFGMIRAVPFLMKFQRENIKDPKSKMILKGIVAGSADKTKIENLKLMPVAEETESTGYDKLDKIIRQLNSLLKQYASQKVTDETEREFKIERLNTIRRAIRIVQGSQNIAPLIDVIEVMRKDGEKILEDYNTTYKDRPATRQDSTDKDLSDFAEEMNNYIRFSDMFTKISTFIGNLIYTKEMMAESKTKEEKEYALQMKDVRNKLIEEQELIKELREDIKDAANTFADKHIGQRNLVGGLTKPEAVVKGLSSFFRGVSDLPMASLRVLYKLVTLSKGKASADALKEVEELMAIRDKIAKSGRDLRQAVRQIYQSDDKGGLVNKLIYKYKKEFYDLIKEKKEEGGDKKWLLENINVEEYKKEALEKMNENIEKIKKRRYPGSKEEEEEKRDELILDEKRRWDITRKDFNGWDNYIIKRHPKDIWLSDEYKKIQTNPELLELYNFITKFNEKAKSVGYIENKVASVFLPFIRKSMAESLVWDGSLSAIQNFSNNLALRADDVGYGKFNELTGELENSIPKYYTYDFTKKSDGTNDYSEVSEDLFKNLILYIQHVNKYKYMSEIEGQLQLVKTIEEFKGNLNTNIVGNVLEKDGRLQQVPNNKENAQTFDLFLRALLYEQKYPMSDSDTPLKFGKVLNSVKKIVNKVAGKEIWKEDENPSASSLVKTMDAANRAFQLKTLGLNPISGAVNAFGANIQMSTQAGKYFKSREFLKNEMKLMSMKFSSEEERQMFMQAVDLFMPLKDDPSYELYKKAGMSAATRRSAADDLMLFMRYPEQVVEKAVFETLLENSMIENGRIVNIHDFVKNKYKGRTREAGKYRETKAKIEQEVEELKKTRSIAKTRKLENGKLVIPGLDLNNREELQRLTNLTRTISRNATGGMADGDVNKMSMSIWGKSAMVFRGWIPKLADTRFSEFRKVSDDFSVRVNDQGEMEGERYDIGRIRLFGHVFMNSLSKASGGVIDIIQMNEKGIDAIDKLYEEYAKKYEDATGQKMTMDRDEFADMIRTNLRNQIKELVILGTLMATMFTLGFFAPDDDDDKAAKNAFRYTQKVVNKFVDELMFFYNPANLEQLISGSAFPAVGLIADFYKAMTSLFMETTGFDFTDPSKTPEEIRKKAMPIKRIVNLIPAGKSFMTWIAMIDADFAKEYDITVQKETSVR